MGNNAPRRIAANGSEQDVFSRYWRQRLYWTQRPGAAHRIKQMAARRQRRIERQDLKDQKR